MKTTTLNEMAKDLAFRGLALLAIVAVAVATVGGMLVAWRILGL